MRAWKKTTMPQRSLSASAMLVYGRRYGCAGWSGSHMTDKLKLRPVWTRDWWRIRYAAAKVSKGKMRRGSKTSWNSQTSGEEKEKTCLRVSNFMAMVGVSNPVFGRNNSNDHHDHGQPRRSRSRVQVHLRPAYMHPSWQVSSHSNSSPTRASRKSLPLL